MTITNSRLAVYKGLIALAWADHDLADEERAKLHQMIDGNAEIPDTKKAELHANIDTKITLADVWEEITDKQDRAFLLNASDAVFHSDGEYCENERELYQTYLANHLGTLNTEAIQEELAALAYAQKAQRMQLRAEMEEYRQQFRITNRIAALFGKTFQ